MLKASCWVVSGEDECPAGEVKSVELWAEVFGGIDELTGPGAAELVGTGWLESRAGDERSVVVSGD